MVAIARGQGHLYHPAYVCYLVERAGHRRAAESTVMSSDSRQKQKSHRSIV